MLQPLGIKPGERISFDKLPGGELRLRAAWPAANITSFIGMFGGRADKTLSIENMNEITAARWAGEP